MPIETDLAPQYILQQVTADANNSSTDNLVVGNSYTFTGTKTSTLGVAGIQVSLYTDKNCRVQVQQSQDGTNWDLTDTYYYTASDNFGLTVQAISSYARVLVLANAETTTVFRLQTALCPIVEPLPRSLDHRGNLRISTPVDAYGFGVENTLMGEMRIAEPVRLVGTSFEGSTIDPNFWAVTAACGASAVQGGGELVLTSSSAATASAISYTIRRARYVGGAGPRYRAAIQLSAGTANNVRRWGIGWSATTLPAFSDGAWFMYNGTTFQVQIAKNGSLDTIASFNGNLGATYNPGTTVKTYEIYWTNSKVYFVVGDTILHVVTASSATWASTMSFHAFADNINSASATSATLAIRTATIYRLGRLETQPQYGHIVGASAAAVMKYGAGFLHKVVVNKAGTLCTIYDNIGASNPSIAILDINKTSGTIGSIAYDVPFFNGLCLATTGDTDITVVYE